MKKNSIKITLIVVQVLLAVLVIQQIARVYSDSNGITGNITLNATSLADPFLGPENASIVIVEYSDFQCPYCSAATGDHKVLVDRFKSQMPGWTPAVPSLEQMAREGKIKFVFKHFPLSIHANAEMGAEASEAANAQGKFWEYHNALFAKAGTFDYNTLIEIAKQLNLDVDRFKKELDSGMYADSVKADMEEGKKAGVTGTPAFLVNEQLISGAQPFSVFEEAIKKLQ